MWLGALFAKRVSHPLYVLCDCAIRCLFLNPNSGFSAGSGWLDHIFVSFSLVLTHAVCDSVQARWALVLALSLRIRLLFESVLSLLLPSLPLLHESILVFESPISN